MTRREIILDEVEKTLRCLGQVDGVEASPFFFARLEARIASLEGHRKGVLDRVLGTGHLRPVLVAAIAIINVISAVVVLHDRGYRSSVRSEYVSALASQYSIEENGYYLLGTGR